MSNVLPVGCRVTAHSLVKHSELNGIEGVIVGSQEVSTSRGAQVALQVDFGDRVGILALRDRNLARARDSHLEVSNGGKRVLLSPPAALAGRRPPRFDPEEEDAENYGQSSPGSFLQGDGFDFLVPKSGSIGRSPHSGHGEGPAGSPVGAALKIGDKVVAARLTQSPELNGVVGVVVGHQRSPRGGPAVRVNFGHPYGDLALRARNLDPIDDQPLPRPL
eukprot:Hpha_TRINITY_DN14869_c5_g3::TRINITY_DN14869_c5_g3_i1::g.169581::m.169581